MVLHSHNRWTSLDYVNTMFNEMLELMVPKANVKEITLALVNGGGHRSCQCFVRAL